MKKSLLLTAFIGTSVLAQSQTMFQEVRAIIDANCAVTCHNYGNLSGNLNLTGTDAEVRNALVNITPQNATAAAKGDKLVKPGYPERSYLLRKCKTTEWGSEYTLDQVNEGSMMPPPPASWRDWNLPC